jgi:hypothetical protein
MYWNFLLPLQLSLREFCYFVRDIKPPNSKFWFPQFFTWIVLSLTRWKRKTNFSLVQNLTYFHEFRIYESTIFFMKKVLFSFKEAANCLFLKKNNRKILPYFKRKHEKFHEENSWIHRFGIRENMLRCYSLNFRFSKKAIHFDLIFLLDLMSVYMKRQIQVED